jgi:hypothetical protein
MWLQLGKGQPPGNGQVGDAMDHGPCEQSHLPLDPLMSAGPRPDNP